MWMEGKVEELAKGEVWVGRGLCGMEGDLRDLRGGRVGGAADLLATR